MADIKSSTALYLLPGMKAQIMLNINPNDNRSILPTESPTYRDSTGTDKPLTNGFYVENEDVGTIEALDENLGFGVLYWHKKPEANIIVYITEIPDIIAECHVIAVPIHDHSSIVQGGPAYGTYFSDDS
jgi:hypothetical protein